jgi:cytochrome c553
MRKRLILVLLGICIAFIAIQSCEEEEHGNETVISYYNSDESHKAGSNCMNCHLSGGPGEGWFTVAGTVYDSTRTDLYPGTTVKLYTGPNGTGDLRATLEVDLKGNFYTTEPIEFGDGLFTLVEGDLTTQPMNSKVTTGACNSCHGNSTEKIWAR